ncbi:MAG TPA: glycosyltransferase [Pyrinomonadaceae bacterium]|jgi:glycosyltransferase involved in cell wall biosynthesis
MSEAENILTKRVGSLVSADDPAVSVIIPNYNTAQYIAETLDSVLRQTFQNYEIIVINDAAPDTEALKKVLENYYERIVFVDKSLNEGTSATRNRAASLARGALLAFLDADDVWQPTFLAELYEFLGKNDYDMVYADAELFGPNYLAGDNFLACNPAQGTITRELLIGGKCHILPSGALIKKNVFQKAGGFDPKVRRTEDFDLWMRMIFGGTRIGYLRKLLFKFRLRPESGSGDSLQRIERGIDCWRILQEKLPFTDEENRIIERHCAIANSGLLRARGRLYINQKNWSAAKETFREARRQAIALGLPLKHRLKMSAVLFLLNFSPGLLLKLFRSLRADEIQYMPSETAN